MNTPVSGLYKYVLCLKLHISDNLIMCNSNGNSDREEREGRGRKSERGVRGKGGRDSENCMVTLEFDFLVVTHT